MEALIIYGIGVAVGLGMALAINRQYNKPTQRELEKARKKEKFRETRQALKDADISYVDIGDGNLVVNFNSLDLLSGIRSKLRECLGQWEDEKEMIWTSRNMGLCSWKGKHHPIELRFRCPADEFPEELQSDNCRMVKETRDEWAYVCS